MRTKSLAAVVAAAILLGTATGVASAAPAPSGLNWGACPAETPGTTVPPPTRDPDQRCARIQVPLDYRNPTGPTIGIEISRLITALPGEKLGDLVIGPGGPGGSGLEGPSQALTDIPRTIRDHYDMIGLDYRGVGNSTPVTCGVSAADRSIMIAYPYPAPDGDISANVAFAKRIAADCARNGGPDLPFMTTQNTARDLDRIRVALGDATLSYIGTSYGTDVGLAYSSLFPENIGHMILNSSVAPQGEQADMRLKGLGVEQAFDGFAQWAAGQDSTYHLGTTPAAVRAVTLQTASALDSDPVALPDGITLSGNVLRISIQSFLEQPTWFPIVAGMIDIGVTRQPPPAGTSLPVVLTEPDNFISDQDAVICGDNAAPSSLAWYRQQVAIDRQRYPLTAGAPGNVLPCAFWPYQPIEKPFVVNDHGPRDIMMLQNEQDPSAAYAGALESRDALGHRAELVSVRAIGHGVPLTDACVGTDVQNFLLQNTMATHDVTCS